jgi:hypothetical protein
MQTLRAHNSLNNNSKLKQCNTTIKESKMLNNTWINLPKTQNIVFKVSLKIKISYLSSTAKNLHMLSPYLENKAIKIYSSSLKVISPTK